MKKIILLILFTFSLTALADDYKYLVLEYEDSNANRTHVKIKITKNMVDSRYEKTILCRTRLNMKYSYVILAGDYVFIEEIETRRTFRESKVTNFEAIDNVYSSIADRSPDEYFKANYLRIININEYNEAIEGGANFPSIENLKEVSISVKDNLQVTNTFVCVIIDPKTGEILNP